jgi:enamine deaminase RidA (YjgF/YER057c/UK114 family)
MATTIHSELLFSEEIRFSQGMSAGEFTFLAQDARRSNGALNETSAQDQTLRTLENLEFALKTAGLDLGNVVSLLVYLPHYPDATEVAQVLRTTFGESVDGYPATTLIGVAGLEGGCRIRMDAIATPSRDRAAFRLADLPFATGSRCHGVCVGNLFFLSGVDAAGVDANIVSAATIQSQTTEVLGRISRILHTQDLALSDLCRTFMFMPSTDYRPGYGEARKKVYQGIFRRR